jgi:hypothetical protein
MGVENSTDTSLNLGNNARDPYIFADGDDGVWQISNNWELQVNEPLSPPIFPVPFRQDGASLFDDIDRVELQYELSE